MANTTEALASELIDELRRTLSPNALRGKVRRYLAGQHDLPYMPEGAKKEYLSLAKKSITNILPLVSDTYAKGLFVEGFRASSTAENANPWRYWQQNGLDARQTMIHRLALEYGESYLLVLPGDPVPTMKPLSPLKVYALYEDDDDDYPVQAIVRTGTKVDGTELYQLYVGPTVYELESEADKNNRPDQAYPDRKNLLDDGPRVVGQWEHGFHSPPLVRFRERLDAPGTGIIWPLIPLNDQLNDVAFSQNMALQYAGFRQRWATGLAIPVDDQEILPDGSPNPNFGRPVESFEAAVDRLWVSDSSEAKFGEFGQTDVRGHLESKLGLFRTMSSVSQISPLMFLGDLVNLSGDALASIQSTTNQRIAFYEILFGEKWEQALRLAAWFAGDMEAANDDSAEVRWRDHEARALETHVKSLGIMVKELGVPATELWERIPNTTQQDVERWKEAAESQDGLALLTAELQRQSQPAAGQQEQAPTTAA